MEWVKKHVDTVVVLGGILSAMIWINAKFADVHNDHKNLEKDVAVIKTVLMLKEIYPKEMAANSEKELKSTK